MTADATPRYAVIPHARAPLSAQEALLVTREGGRHVLTHEVFDALQRMRFFASLEDHLQQILDGMPQLAGHGKQAVRRVLENLVQRGLLVDEVATWQRLGEPRAIAQSLPLTVVCVLSGRDPLPGLRALVESLAGVPQSRIYVVVPAGVAAPETAALAAAVAPLPVEVLDPAMLSARIAGLAARIDPAAPAVALGLLGAEANIAQLLGAGGRVLWIDDRLHWPLRRLHAGQEIVPWCIDDAPQRQVALFGGHRQALAAGAPMVAGLGTLLGLCGAPVGALVDLGQRADAAALQPFGPMDLEHLSADSRIRSVVAGTLGCAEGEHSLWMYLLDDATRAELTRSREGYDAGIEAGAIAHGVEQPRLQRVGAYRPLLLDASRCYGLVPGSTRHSERVLHALGSFADPHSLSWHSELLTGRSTVLARARAQANLDVAAPSLNAFVADQALQRRDDVQHVDAASRHALLAAYLRDLAHAPRAQRQALLWEYTAFQSSRTVATLQQAIELAGPEAARYWHADLAQIVQNQGKALLGARVARLAETPEGADQAQAADHLAQLLEAAALKLELWPRLLEVAATET